MSFADLKNRRQGAISKLTAAAEKVGGDKKSYGDDRLWKLKRDKSDNGYAVLRFLPAAENNELPWTRYWDHGFKGPTGQWYIERSLTSLGQEDPVGQLNGKLWNSGVDADKETARIQKRRLHHVANVMVISDPANPQNEGKIMLYEFGKKIFDKIMDAMKPEYPDEKPMNPFDFWAGADFKLKCRKVDGWINYDKSEFASPAAVSEDDEQLEAIYGKLFDLREFTDPDNANYKTYSELQARLNTVLGEAAAGGAPTMRQEAMMGGTTPPPQEKQSYEVSTAETVSFSEPEATAEPEGDVEDVMAAFARLANED